MTPINGLLNFTGGFLSQIQGGTPSAPQAEFLSLSFLLLVSLQTLVQKKKNRAGVGGGPSGGSSLRRP